MRVPYLRSGPENLPTDSGRLALAVDPAFEVTTDPRESEPGRTVKVHFADPAVEVMIDKCEVAIGERTGDCRSSLHSADATIVVPAAGESLDWKVTYHYGAVVTFVEAPLEVTGTVPFHVIAWPGCGSATASRSWPSRWPDRLTLTQGEAPPSGGPATGAGPGGARDATDDRLVPAAAVGTGSRNGAGAA